MAYRGHEPNRIEKFNGLWRRGNDDSCPLDHFSDCENIAYFPDGVRTRDALTVELFGASQELLTNAVRMYTYVNPSGVQSLIILDSLGNIYDSGSPTPTTPILTIATMTDFAFANVSGRAYISPHDGVTGLENEFLYVYLGDGSLARKACGPAPTSAPTLNGFVLGKVEAGTRVFGVVYETNTGFRTKIGPLATITIFASYVINVSAIPTSPNTFVVARWIVCSKAINPASYTGNPLDYELFFVPNGRIDDNTTTVLDVDFYDSELLSSADGLVDAFEEMAAGVFLGTYHDRMLLGGQFGTYNINPDLDTSALMNTCWVSNKGEPEAFDSVDGLIVMPKDGHTLSNGQEYRDILYLFKNTKTISYNDNGDKPSTWVGIVLDQGSGASVHGVATVLDSGGVNVDYLVITNFTGVCLFNGSFIRPELSWKIETYWLGLDQTEYNLLQLVNDPISKQIFICLQNSNILFGDYTEGLDPMKIKWGRWTFNMLTTTIAIMSTNKLMIGSRAIPDA